MPSEDFAGDLFALLNTALALKAFLILFLVFYFVFALIIFRQIQLMAKALSLPLNAILKFLAIIQIGVVLATVLAIIGTL